MRMELGDHSTVRCEKTDLVADIEFKTKGFIGGKYDTIHGIIRHESSGEKLYEIEGKWNEKMTIKNLKTKKTETFFDATGARETLISTKDINSMAERESRKLWRETTDAIKARDQTTATNAKSLIEDGQRDEAKVRSEKGETWTPKFFDQTGPEEYSFKIPHGISGKALTDHMEEMTGGITSSRTPTANTSSTVTASGLPAEPGRSPTAPAPSRTVPSASADARQQEYQPRPPAPAPSAVPSSHPNVHEERPKLVPVDSENQPFHDAQEDFDKLTIH